MVRRWQRPDEPNPLASIVAWLSVEFCPASYTTLSDSTCPARSR